MKFNLDIKNKKAEFQANIENVVEKGMDQHEKDWKDKFNTKHNAKKEILEIKHKQKLEIEETSREKRNWFDRIQENKRKQKELELEDRRRREAEERIERQKIFKIKLVVSVILGIITIILVTVGSLLGYASGDPNSGWHAIAILGLFTGMAIIYIWILGDDPKKKK